MKLSIMVSAAAIGVSGCALTSKSEALDIRYFTPEQGKPHLTSSAPKTRGPALRMGRVTSGLHLRDRVVYRDAAHEVAYYEQRRWTERPDVYVRRELSRALFEDGRFERAIGGAGPTLDVEVVAFEEVKVRGAHTGRVVLTILLHDERAVLLEETLAIDQPVAAPGDATAAVAAIAAALDSAVDQVARHVAGAMH